MASQLEIIVSIKQMGAAALDKVRSEILKVEVAAKRLARVQNLIGGAAVLGSVTTFINAYEESRRATMRLQQALENVGDTYKAHEQDIISVTKALQQKTNYGDDEQIAALAELIPLVGSYEKAMKALPEILNLAAFTQEKDLNTATATYAQLLNGELPKALAKSMPMLKEMRENGASVAEIMQAVNEKTKGFAEIDVSPAIQFKNMLGDTAEDIGELILPSLTAMVDLFKSLPGLVKGVVVALPPLILMLGTLGGPLTAAVAGLGLLALAISKMSANMKEKQADIAAFDKSMKDAFETAKFGKTLDKDFEEAGARMSAAYFGGFTANLTEEQFKKLPEDVKAGIEKQMRAAEAAAKTAPGGKKTVKGEKVFDQHAEDMQRFRETVKLGEQIIENKKSLVAAEEEIERQRQANADASIEHARQLMAEEEFIAQAKLDSAQSVAGSLAQLASVAAQKNKEWGIAYKAFAIAEATINTYRAASQALVAPPGPPISFGYVFAAIAAGIANVAQITSQAFATGTPFAPGGMALVGENGPELVNLSRGSQVFNNSQTRNMVTNNNQPVIVIAGGNIQKQLEQATRNKSINWPRLLNQAGVALA